MRDRQAGSALSTGSWGIRGSRHQRPDITSPCQVDATRGRQRGGAGTSFHLDRQGTATAAHAMKRYYGLLNKQETKGMPPTQWLAAKELMV
ncbi:hypothetical protein ACFC00_31255 [Streptomyces adustus]|uniref:hypothetical protein n=1 Tax=Streptomyces adustus TaxID=1609272 RepID=UPI0035DCCE31